MERYEKWEPIAGIEAPCMDAVIRQVDVRLTVHLLFTTSYGGTGRDLMLTFAPRVIAFMSHGEFEHPWNDQQGRTPPPMADNPPPYTFVFPLLKVIDSEWLASFSDSRIFDHERPTVTHYRIVTMADTVDVLTQGAVTAEWTNATL